MTFTKFAKLKEAFTNAQNFMLVHHDGTVIQTDFQPPINIPKVGENIVEMVKHFRRFMDLCKLEGELYRKQVFDTANMIIIFARLDENNHLGLFFHKDKIVENQIQFVEKTFKIIEDVQKEPSEAPPEEVDLI